MLALTPEPPASFSFPTRRSSDLLSFRHVHAGGGAFGNHRDPGDQSVGRGQDRGRAGGACEIAARPAALRLGRRSEEHTSELQSPCNIVCRLLLKKRKNRITDSLM